MRRAAALVAAALALATACGDDDGDGPVLPAADVLAGGGDAVPAADVEATALDLSEARHVFADGDGGFWIVTGRPLEAGGTLLELRDGRVVAAVSLDTDGTGDTDGSGATGEPSVGYPTDYAAWDADAGLALASAGGGDAWLLSDTGHPERRIPGLSDVGGLAIAPDGAVVVADRDAEVVTRYGPSAAGEEVGSTFGLPVSLAVLPDGRAAVVTDRAGTRFLRLVEGADEAPSLLSGSDEDAVGVVAATPDGRLLVTQSGERVLVIDPDAPSEESVLVDGGGNGAILSVAAAGDDVVLLYAERLWRLPDAL